MEKDTYLPFSGIAPGHKSDSAISDDRSADRLVYVHVLF